MGATGGWNQPRRRSLGAAILVAGLFALCPTGCGRKAEAPPPSPSKSSPKPPATGLQAEAETPPPSLTVFSSFDTNGDYNTRFGWAIMDASAESEHNPERFKPDLRDGDNINRGYRGQAEWFTPEISGKLDLIQIAIRQNQGGSGRAHIFLAEDKGGLPGAILETFSNVVCSASANQPLRPVRLDSETHPALTQGKKYWVCAEPAAGQTSSTWYGNKRGLSQGFAYERAPWQWSFVSGGPENSAFSVNVVPNR